MPKPVDRSRGAVFARYRIGPDPDAVKRARDAFLGSRKPALLVGGGALISNAGKEVRALAEHLDSPVCTTITGKGIIEETGQNFPGSLPVVSDVRLAIRDLLGLLGKDRPRTDWPKDQLARMREDWYRSAAGKKGKDGDPMKPQAIMDVVNRVVTEEDMVVCDASLASGSAAAYCRMPKPGRRFLAPRGLAGLGWGAPAAIGAALATGKKQRILLFAGDGGFASIIFSSNRTSPSWSFHRSGPS
jgi:thiamine pyrophosphate-dependent acetolactate synthase large subunit-like protein